MTSPAEEEQSATVYVLAIHFAPGAGEALAAPLAEALGSTLVRGAGPAERPGRRPGRRGNLRRDPGRLGLRRAAAGQRLLPDPDHSGGGGIERLPVSGAHLHPRRAGPHRHFAPGRGRRDRLSRDRLRSAGDAPRGADGDEDHRAAEVQRRPVPRLGRADAHEEDARRRADHHGGSGRALQVYCARPAACCVSTPPASTTSRWEPPFSLRWRRTSRF